jgi:ribosome biogenesis GTPase A
MSFSKLTKKRLFLIGPPGCGKSRTANTLIGSEAFPWGSNPGRHTIEIQIETHETGLTIVDLPGKVFNNPNSNYYKIFLFLRIWD